MRPGIFISCALPAYTKVRKSLLATYGNLHNDEGDTFAATNCVRTRDAIDQAVSGPRIFLLLLAQPPFGNYDGIVLSLTHVVEVRPFVARY